MARSKGWAVYSDDAGGGDGSTSKMREVELTFGDGKVNVERWQLLSKNEHMLDEEELSVGRTLNQDSMMMMMMMNPQPSTPYNKYHKDNVDDGKQLD